MMDKTKDEIYAMTVQTTKIKVHDVQKHVEELFAKEGVSHLQP